MGGVTRGLVGVMSAAVLVLGGAVPGHAAATPGGACSRPGVMVKVAGSELRCVKKSGRLVWVKVNPGSGAGTGNSVSGIASNASIPKVMQNWGLALAPFDAATGKAGVMQIAGLTPPTFGNPSDDALYRHIVGLYGERVRNSLEPQLVFIAPLGTPVISTVDGTVCDMPRLYSSDLSVRVAPTGTACSNGAAAILFEHEHLINPLVKVGDQVKAGQKIGVVSDYNPHWKAKGQGLVDIGVFFSKVNSPLPWHACPSTFLAPAKKDGLLDTLSSIQKAWTAERGDPSLYNLAAQNPVGCLTKDDISDNNKFDVQS